ncbi:MAG: DUF3800 domain-containing protein [Microbacterium sp.]
MLLAYLDEIGETGAFVSRADARYNTSPAFGYAGYVVNEGEARAFGQAFTEQKRKVFATEIAANSRPAQWERKGSDLFRASTIDRYPQQIRVFNGLVRRLRSFGGHLFYYADEKQIGSPKQTSLDTVARESSAMKETLNRLARHADESGENLLVMMDQINEKQRVERMPAMYAHMFGRSGQFEEMKRIVEPPMHIDSAVSANIQFADWVAACVSRAIDYQLIENSGHAWISGNAVDAVRGAFTHESKVHLWHRAVDDLHHSTLFRHERPLFPKVSGARLGATVDPIIVRKMKAAAERAHPHSPHKDI